MNMTVDLILTAFMGVCLLLCASSRLLHCIRVVALQGILLGILPLVMWNWGAGAPGAELWLSSLINIVGQARRCAMAGTFCPAGVSDGRGRETGASQCFSGA